MGKPSLFNDFSIDTNGHCFICLNKVTSECNATTDNPGRCPASSASAAAQTSQSSLHSLSRYLKMDMSQVFHEKESIPSELLDNVKRSQLKVSLCQDCSIRNKRISDLFQQLVKIETEMDFHVQLIHGSLSTKLDTEGDIKTDLLYKFDRRDTQRQLNAAGLLENLRIVKALRTEVMQRCSRKLATVRPRVKFQRLTPNQVYSTRQRIQTSHPRNKTNNSDQRDQILAEPAELFCDINDFKYEGSDTGDGNQDFDSYPEPIGDGHSEAAQSNNNGWMNESSNPNLKTEFETAKNKTTRRDVTTTEKSSTKLFPPSNFLNKVPPLTFDKNPRTRKFKCNICSVECVKRYELRDHYEAIHLKIKHKCNLCGKEFLRRTSYNCHHDTVHVGIRFKCTLCGKCFTQKLDLNEHQQSVHLGVRFQCTVCPRKFVHKRDLRRHVKNKSHW